MSPLRLRPFERLLEVGDDVVCILTPYGDAKQARRDAGGRELLVIELTMARRCRVEEDRVDTAQARGTETELEAVEEPLRGLPPAGNFDSEQRSGAGQLSERELVLRVTVEPGVHHFAHLRVSLEEACKRERVR